MGVIIRQSMKSTIATYLGTGIGILSSLFIYPSALALYGAMQFIMDTASLLGSFCSLGINALTLKFFPDFENKEKKNHGFLGLLILLLLGALFISALIGFLFKEVFFQGLERLGLSVERFQEYSLSILLITVCTVFIAVGSSYASNFKRIVIPRLIQDLSLKIGLPIFILAFTAQWITATQVEYLVVAVFFFIVIAIYIYLAILGALDLRTDFSILTKKLARKMANFAAYGALSSVGALFMLRIDSIMVTTMINEEANGIYKISSLIIMTMAIPMNSLIKISDPIISKFWKNNNLTEIGQLYQRSSNILLLVGIFIFLGIWISIDEVFRLTGNYEDMVLGKSVVLFIGLGKLVDLLSGVNGSIIIFSKYYRFNLLLVLILGVVNIFFNLLLIPRFNMEGAALATMISLMVYNLIKFLFIWVKFKLQPLNSRTLLVILIGVATYFLSFIIPSTSYSLLNIAINSLLVVVAFLIPVLYFKLVPDINAQIEKLWKRMQEKV